MFVLLCDSLTPGNQKQIGSFGCGRENRYEFRLLQFLSANELFFSCSRGCQVLSEKFCTEAPELYQKKNISTFCAPASCLVIPFVCIHFYECFRKNLLLAKKGRRALSLRKANSQMQIAEDSSPSARILCKFIHKTMIIPLKMQTKVFLLCSHSRSATEKLRDIKSLCNGCRLRRSRVGRLLGRAWIFFNCNKMVLAGLQIKNIEKQVLWAWRYQALFKTFVPRIFLE